MAEVADHKRAAGVFMVVDADVTHAIKAGTLASGMRRVRDL